MRSPCGGGTRTVLPLIFLPIFSVFSQVFLTLLFLGLISKRNECDFRT